MLLQDACKIAQVGQCGAFFHTVAQVFIGTYGLEGTQGSLQRCTAFANRPYIACYSYVNRPESPQAASYSPSNGGPVQPWIALQQGMCTLTQINDWITQNLLNNSTLMTQASCSIPNIQRLSLRQNLYVESILEVSNAKFFTWRRKLGKHNVR